jgi:hypothetical protein
LPTLPTTRNLSTVNSDASHVIEIGHGDVIVVPAARDAPRQPGVGRRRPVDVGGGMQFLNGGTVPVGPTSNGQLITDRFSRAADTSSTA